MTFADLSPLANHVWQSTLCAAVAWLLTLAIRKNRPAVRYWIWLAASVKFLIPFAWLAGVGASFHWCAVPVAGTVRIPALAAQIGQPFEMTAPVALPSAAAPVAHLWPAVLLSVWLCGVALGLVFWARSRRRMGGILRGAKALDLNLPIPVMAAPGRMEPGVFGIWKPVLLLPQGITERLTPGQLEAILAHELRHVHRRDNLTAAIHMLVETVFWFHPAVWWIRKRLVEERERACDEGVLRLGSEPQVYAESILKVCEFYLAAPAACAAGVSGGGLKRRIEGIMENRFTRKLSYGKRTLLAAAAALFIAGPVVVGLLNPPRGRAQSQAGGAAPAFEVASIKKAPLPFGPGMWMGCPSDPGRITCTNMNLANLVITAYGIQHYQLSGLSTDDMDRFDIAVKVPEGATQEQVKLMWQNLLAERFKLAVHRENREASVYELLVAKGGPKMQESVEAPPPGSDTAPSPQLDPGPPWKLAMGKDGFPDLPSGTSMAVIDGKARWRATKATTEQIASKLAAQLGQPVTDATGLKAKYDFRLSWSTESLSAGRVAAIASKPEGGSPLAGIGESEDGPTLLSAIQSQLGLKLERKKGSIEMLVVDHVDKVPTEN